MDYLGTFSSAIDSANVHTKENGFTLNCGNLAVAIYEIAVEEFGFDGFRFAVVDRPSHLGSGADHIALKFDGKYLDSKGIHTHTELLRLVDDGNTGGMSEAVLQIESYDYVTDVFPQYDESTKNRLKKLLKEEL